jgi:hypothetical protein
MSEETRTPARPKRSRRELLAGATGAAGLIAAPTVLGAKPAYAGTDGDVILVQDNQLTSGATGVQSTNITGLHGRSTASNGTGVFGEDLAIGGIGVHGTGYSHGVKGDGGSTGVFGKSDSIGVYGEGAVGVSGAGLTSTGVYGQTNANNASGVYGQNIGTGNGVRGLAPAGTGVLAESDNGTALQVNGKAGFSRSGIATVQASSKNVTVNNVALTSSSFILATVQDETNVAVKAVVRNLASNSFKIVLTKATTVNTPVGWFVVN